MQLDLHFKRTIPLEHAVSGWQVGALGKTRDGNTETDAGSPSSGSLMKTLQER